MTRFFKLLREMFDAIVFALSNKNDAADVLPSDIEPQKDVDANVPIDGPKSEKTNGQKFYEECKKLLGQTIIPLTELNKYGVLGCAQHLNAVYKRVFGVEIGGGASTALMWAALKDTTRFKEILDGEEDLPGDIWMYATGTSRLHPQAHGHVLVRGVRWCMSNSSETGEWEANYTIEGCKKYFGEIMGFPLKKYRIVDK